MLVKIRKITNGMKLLENYFRLQKKNILEQENNADKDG
jgi:hypothetical protein